MDDRISEVDPNDMQGTFMVEAATVRPMDTADWVAPVTRKRGGNANQIGNRVLLLLAKVTIAWAAGCWVHCMPPLAALGLAWPYGPESVEIFCPGM